MHVLPSGHWHDGAARCPDAIPAPVDTSPWPGRGRVPGKRHQGCLCLPDADLQTWRSGVSIRIQSWRIYGARRGVSVAHVWPASAWQRSAGALRHPYDDGDHHGA